MTATDAVAQEVLACLAYGPLTVRDIQTHTRDLTDGQIRRRLRQMEEAGLVACVSRRGNAQSPPYLWRAVDRV